MNAPDFPPPENPDILNAGSNVGFFQSTDGQPFAFTRVAGTNPVCRRSLDQEPDAPWRSMSWLLNLSATDLAWDAGQENLVLTTDNGDVVTSADGGFRWSFPCSSVGLLHGRVVSFWRFFHF